MASVMSHCTTCKKPTPHRTAGVREEQRAPDGRVSQMMECAICKTSTRVYFTDAAEFQENLELPDDREA